jgi:NTE family protein
MNRKRIAIACQGGGSQCAFVAGALEGLFAEGLEQRFDIVGLSGTSGGALTAALAWAGLLDHRRGGHSSIGERLLACWRDLSAQTPQEIAFDQFMVESLRLVQRGVLPSFATSPSSPRVQLMSKAAASAIGRPEFTDLRALLVKHIDFEDLVTEPDDPVLLVGACDVLEGTFKVFSSARGEISIDALMASAAVPTLFPTAMVDGHAYWDGIFSANPPIVAFLQKVLMRQARMPEEIWIIQVNPSRYDFVPESADEIFDRRNHLAGNLSVRHELQLIEMVNLLLQENALTERFKARFGLEATQTIGVRFIRMSPQLQEGLDYPTKLSRNPTHIARLIADGEAQARAFLAEEEPEQPVEAGAEVAPLEVH